MATIQKPKEAGRNERVRLYFSEDFKVKKVREIERNLVSVQQVSREYGVSRAGVYKWLYKYSTMRKKAIRMVVESKSDTVKIVHLREQVKELERMIGQKQIVVDFLEKMIELAEQEYGVDIKKKFSSKPSAGSGITEKSTGRK